MQMRNTFIKHEGVFIMQRCCFTMDMSELDEDILVQIYDLKEDVPVLKKSDIFSRPHLNEPPWLDKEGENTVCHSHIC